MEKLRRSRYRSSPDGDLGFTLIELLVVILIIGILAAIAIPLFLSQRRKAFDRSVRSDLRNVAHFQESYFVDYFTYATAAQLTSSGNGLVVSPKNTVEFESVDSSGICLKGTNADLPYALYWDSQAGGLQPTGSTGCPVSTGGSSGGSFSRP